ncbi:hypothetical protein A2U01_0118408, partial [Trifolium medium]|nr:hypothetical protein [Trifolium medium]
MFSGFASGPYATREDVRATRSRCWGCPVLFWCLRNAQ